MIIGLTGCTGSGKSVFLDYLQNYFKFRTIDLDFLGHEVLKQSAIKAALVACFGRGVMQDSGDIDRVVLGQLVFSSADALSLLNELILPKIKELVLEMIKTMELLGHDVMNIGSNDFKGGLDFLKRIE